MDKNELILECVKIISVTAIVITWIILALK